jgi:hypothetical protein
LASAEPIVTSAQAPRPHYDLAALLEEGLRRLADAGEVDPACRLAGQAHAALRHQNPAAAHRFNILLHRLTRRLVDD